MCELDSPLVGLELGAFAVGHTTLKVVSSKVVKHKKLYSDNQRHFLPFVFDLLFF